MTINRQDMAWESQGTRRIVKHTLSGTSVFKRFSDDDFTDQVREVMELKLMLVAASRGNYVKANGG